MQALFIHGMGRSPLSGWPLLRQLKRAGHTAASFGYTVSRDDFSTITAKLVTRITKLAAHGDYVLIGHSLGGVLLRAAVNALPPGTRLPHHVFLLGSPMQPARLAQLLQDKLLYRLATRDCGQLLGSRTRMQGVPRLSVPTTVVIGTRGISAKHGPFGGEENDGVVSASEVAANWASDEVRVPVVHTFLPSSQLVSGIILQRLSQRDSILPVASV
jgi:hypothetical protein